MKHALGKAILILSSVLLLSACIEQTRALRQQDAIETAWKTLDPNTISHNREDWEIHEAAIVYGKDVVKVFSNGHTIKACPGPAVPENLPIKTSSQYWYIMVVPHPQAMRPLPPPNSATVMPTIPEPNFKEAAFLIDIYDGDVVARKLICQ
jgi:hypothetical protein